MCTYVHIILKKLRVFLRVLGEESKFSNWYEIVKGSKKSFGDLCSKVHRALGAVPVTI